MYLVQRFCDIYSLTRQNKIFSLQMSWCELIGFVLFQFCCETRRFDLLEWEFTADPL